MNKFTIETTFQTYRVSHSERLTSNTFIANQLIEKIEVNERM